MTRTNIAGLTGAASAFVLALALAVPASAQTKTYPAGTDCSTLSGGDQAACLKQMGNQEDSTTNGATPNPSNDVTNPQPGATPNAIPNNGTNSNGTNSSGATPGNGTSPATGGGASGVSN